MKKFYIFIGVLLLVVGIYDLWYVKYSKNKRIHKIIEESMQTEERKEIEAYIMSNSFKEELFSSTFRSIKEHCNLSTIPIKFRTLILNPEKNKCEVLLTVDYLEMECGDSLPYFRIIEFYGVTLEKKENVWIIGTRDTGEEWWGKEKDFNSFANSRLFGVDGKEEFKVLDKYPTNEKKRAIMDSFPLEGYLLDEFMSGASSILTISDTFWFDKK